MSVYRSRVIGLVLIALALATVAFSSQLWPRPIAGIAVAVPVPGPPTVGECVPNSGTTPWNPEGAGVHQPGTHPYLYPRLGVSVCDGIRYGEVTAVIAEPSTAVVTVGADGTITAVTDSNTDSCTLAALRYVGSPTGGQQPQRALSFWYVVPAIDAVASRPSVRQAAAGQHWLACIIFLQQDTYGGVGDLPPSYDSSLRSALQTGVYRDQLGNCFADIDANSSIPTVCGDPHRAETFGFGTTGHTPVGRAGLSRSCSQLISGLTRLPDITARGALAVQLQVTGSDGHLVTGAQIPANSDAVCSINATGGRKLAGSLLAIGTRPIPWT